MLTLFMLADAISTLGLIQVGIASEGNPLMAGLVTSPWLFLAVKGLLGLLGDVILPSVGWIVVYRMLLGIYSLLCIYHCVCWLVG
jgi:hypothetical protein